MSKVLDEYFGAVRSSDVAAYGYGVVEDFLGRPYALDAFDWVITNPPFRLAEEFVLRALPIARRGVAMLTRTVFLESSGRYERLFRDTPPTVVAQFVERVPMVKGRLDQRASTATGYCWLVWRKPLASSATVFWIPPCRKAFERVGDYEKAPQPMPFKPIDRIGAGKADLFGN
ncbi:MAG TPA: SAM-dependent methyltransferase [Phycisphaerae bacterium]|nr:SAM-dependent methyltransferase [Phycisphaerae bacterium]